MSKPLPYETTLEVRDTCLCLHAQRAARALSRRFDAALRPVALTNQQFSLLMSLNRPEPPPLAPVARLLGLDRTTLVAAVKPLERRGLLAVVAGSQGHGRLLRLTDLGREALLAGLPIWRAVHRAIEVETPSLDPDALRTSLRALA